MSFEATAWAIDLKGLKPIEKLVIIALANYADENGNCFPSQAKLKDIACSSERSVRNALNQLEELGFITRKHRQRQDGSRASDFYQLHYKANRQMVPVGSQSNRQILPIQPAPRAGHEPITEPITNKKLNKKDDQLSEHFDKLLSKYPKRHVSHPRKLGMAALKAALKKTTIEKLLSAAEIYARQAKADGSVGTAYVPMISTWLNQERWLDCAPVGGKHDQSSSAPNWPRRAQIWRESGGWSEVWGPPPSSPDFNPPPECKHLFERQMSLT